MIDVDRAWARQANRYPGKKLSDFRLQGITSSYTIGANGTSQNQPVNFGAGSIILGITATARPTGQAATTVYATGLDLFTLAAIYQADNRSIIGTTEALAQSIFGLENDLFPAMEIVMPQNTAIVYNFTNQTSTQILVTLVHHCLLPGAIG